ncbi:MAG TPA: glutamine amidotransferase [Candidatus Angelobacter sp.]|nr:glutamine amidotransferase [Candidatus Angelobacter sp.]
MIGFATIILSNRAWMPAVGVGVVILAVAVLWSWRRSAAQGWVKLTCAILKLAGILALALCLLDPLRVGQHARPGANVFGIIADNSQSMEMKDPGETRSRGEVMREQLIGGGKSWRSALDENFQVRRYTFDSRLQTTKDFSELNFDGRSSALGGALRTAVEYWRGQPVAGVLLFTDGNATDIGADLPSLEGCPPIYPVVVGSDSAMQDISLGKITVSQTAFEDAPVTVQAEANANGFAGSQITTRLIEVGAGAFVTNGGATNASLRIGSVSNVVAKSSQFASGNDATLNYRFQIRPETPGLHFYEVETRVSDETKATATPSREATLANNQQMIVVDRGQEPFRVLYISGRPNWEYKFLNRAIQDDPQVQMPAIIRVAKREPKFEFMGREGESSNPLFRGFGTNDEETGRYDQPVLIRLNTKDQMELRGGFPKTAAELYRYDAVIVGDLEAEFFTHDQMALIQRFVSERGGGFLMLGGAESFREGDYAGTPIASLLPVYLDRPVDAQLPGEFKLTLTREGWLQPWTRLRPVENEEKTRIDEMPAFEVFNPLHDIKPGASVLATVSDANGRQYPALVVQRFGLGRTAALMIGDMWRWGLRDEQMQKDLAKSWRQMVRWLVADVPPRISVSAEAAPGGDASEFRLTVKAHDEEFRPLDNASVKLTVRPVQVSSSSRQSRASAQNFVQLTADPVSGESGTYTATYVAHDTGGYSVEATVMDSDGRMAGRAAAGWTSDPAAEEFKSLKPNRALLESLAKKTGGEVLSMSGLDALVRKLPEKHSPVMETWTYPLWHKPVVLLFALGCFVGEWGLRRWKGMP